MTSDLRARTIEVDDADDPIEFCYEQGWTDGLPVVPPTRDKVQRAIAASGLDGDDVVCEYIERNRVVMSSPLNPRLRTTS